MSTNDSDIFPEKTLMQKLSKVTITKNLQPSRKGEIFLLKFVSLNALVSNISSEFSPEISNVLSIITLIGCFFVVAISLKKDKNFLAKNYIFILGVAVLLFCISLFEIYFKSFTYFKSLVILLCFFYFCYMEKKISSASTAPKTKKSKDIHTGSNI